EDNRRRRVRSTSLWGASGVKGGLPMTDVKPYTDEEVERLRDNSARVLATDTERRLLATRDERTRERGRVQHDYDEAVRLYDGIVAALREEVERLRHRLDSAETLIEDREH